MWEEQLWPPDDPIPFHTKSGVLTAALDGERQVAFQNRYLADRVGWREVTADGEGVRLIDSPVPVASISDELREYPGDLLASPVDVRSFRVSTEPGTNTRWPRVSRFSIASACFSAS